MDWETLTNEFDCFVCHCSNWLRSKQECEVDIRSSDKLCSIELILRQFTKQPFLEFLAESTSCTEFGESAELDFTLDKLINLLTSTFLCIFNNLFLFLFAICHSEPDFRNNRHNRNFMVRNVNIVTTEVDFRLFSRFIEYTSDFIAVNRISLQESDIVAFHEINLDEILKFPWSKSELCIKVNLIIDFINHLLRELTIRIAVLISPFDLCIMELMDEHLTHCKFIKILICQMCNNLRKMFCHF